MLPLKDNTYAISQYNIIHNLICHPYPNNHITSIYFPALKRECECFILSRSPQLWIAYYKKQPFMTRKTFDHHTTSGHLSQCH